MQDDEKLTTSEFKEEKKIGFHEKDQAKEEEEEIKSMRHLFSYQKRPLH